MGKVTTLEDIMEKTKESLPNIDPKILEDVWTAHLRQIYDAARNPNVFRIHLCDKIGALSSNIEYNRDNRTNVAKSRYDIMCSKENKRFKGFNPPYLASIIKKIFKVKKVKYAWKVRKEYLSMISDETNKFYDKYS